MNTMRTPRFLIVTLWALLSITAALGQTIMEIATVVPAVVNTDSPDEDDDLPAYLILKANGNVDLSGWFLTDDAQAPTKWAFPDGIQLSAGQELKVFASGKDRRPPGGEKPLHTNFVYPCSVPYAGLYQSGQQIDLKRDLTDYCECDDVVLIDGKSVVRYIVPNDNVGDAWRQPSYDHSNWERGPLCIGYDAAENAINEGLVLHARMDKLSGTVIPDSSGPTIHDGQRAGNGWANPAGIISDAFRFTCQEPTRIEYQHHPELTAEKNKDFSAAIWVRADPEFPPQAGSYQVIATKQKSLQSPGWSILWTAVNTGNGVSRQVVMRFVDTAGEPTSLALADIRDSQWHHLAFVIDGDGTSKVEIRTFFDGKQTPAPVSLAAGTGFESEDPLYLGNDEGEHPYCGDLDDFAIWNHQLTDVEVSEIYQAGLMGISFADGGGGSMGGMGKFDPLINTDVEFFMKGLRPGLYLRAPFSLNQFPPPNSTLTMRIRYDDGFAAYLNGTLVARRNAPATLNENSRALRDREDCLALGPETIALDASLLRQGANVLAIHALNATVDEDRFLICPELCFEPGQTPRDPEHEDCVKTTRGQEFWLAFPENYEEEPGAPVELSLCITGNRLVTGQVSFPGLSIAPINFNLGAAGKAVVAIPKALELEGADDREAKAIRVVASDFVAVYGQSHIDYTTDTFLGLPIDCLGTDYVVMGYQNVQSNLPLLQGSQLGIVAPYDDTEVRIIPKEKIGSHAAGVPFTITLARGETYQLRTEANSPADITGTCIESNKPIGVFGGHRCANIQSPSQFYCDTVLEQLLPTAAWGTNHDLAPLMTRGGDLVRVLAHRDGTPVFVNFTSADPINRTLDRGEFLEFTTTEPASISAEFSVCVAQFSQSSDFDGVVDGDPFMTLIQPRSAWMRRYKTCRTFPDSYATVVAEDTGALSGVTVNGTGVLAVPGGQSGLTASGGAYARFPLPAGDVFNFLSSNASFGLTLYGFDEYESFGHPGGFCFADITPPVITCPDEITITCQYDGEICFALVPDVIAQSSIYDNVDSNTALFIDQTPKAGTSISQPGTYPITIEAFDLSGNGSTCITKLIVRDPNTPPQALALPRKVAFVNAAESAIDITVGFTDAEQPSDELDYDIVTVLGDTDTFEMVAVDNATKKLQVRCRYNLTGTIDIRLRATDAGGLSTVNSQVISVPGTPYQQWLNKKFSRSILSNPNLQTALWGEHADTDTDGNPTIGEAYHGRDPGANDDVPLDTVNYDEATGEWVVRWRRAVDQNGAEADCQWSLDLGAWYDSGDGPPQDARVIEVTAGAVEGDEQVYEARIPGSSEQRLFFQLRYRRK